MGTDSGVGMGLTMCHNIVRNSGGVMTVQSDGQNRGSTFTFTMRMQKERP